MPIIVPIFKYNDTDRTFSDVVKKDQISKAFSVTHQMVVYDENDPLYDVVIFSNGNCVKNISRDNVHLTRKGDYVTRIANYFKNKKRNVVIEHVLLDSDLPLDYESKVFAEYIDTISSDPTIRSINLIGHSKSGAVFFNMPKYFNNPHSYEKSSIVSTASPFAGCLIATPQLFLKDVKKVIDNFLPEPVNRLVYSALETYYNTFSTHSHMDNDLAFPGYFEEKYDPKFIAGMFDIANIKAVRRLKYFHNFVTGIDERSLLNSLRRGDFTSVGLCLIDRFFMEEITDGFIEVGSQESVDNYFDSPSSRVQSATHYFLSHDDEISIILDYINNKLEEQEEDTKKHRKVL